MNPNITQLDVIQQNLRELNSLSDEAGRIVESDDSITQKLSALANLKGRNRTNKLFGAVAKEIARQIMSFHRVVEYRSEHDGSGAYFISPSETWSPVLAEQVKDDIASGKYSYSVAGKAIEVEIANPSGLAVEGKDPISPNGLPVFADLKLEETVDTLNAQLHSSLKAACIGSALGKNIEGRLGLLPLDTSETDPGKGRSVIQTVLLALQSHMILSLTILFLGRKSEHSLSFVGHRIKQQFPEKSDEIDTILAVADKINQDPEFQRMKKIRNSLIAHDDNSQNYWERLTDPDYSVPLEHSQCMEWIWIAFYCYDRMVEIAEMPHVRFGAEHIFRVETQYADTVLPLSLGYCLFSREWRYAKGFKAIAKAAVALLEHKQDVVEFDGIEFVRDNRSGLLLPIDGSIGFSRLFGRLTSSDSEFYVL